jgi:hypothetical protein
MSLIDLALLPIRVGLGVADAVLKAVTTEAPGATSGTGRVAVSGGQCASCQARSDNVARTMGFSDSVAQSLAECRYWAQRNFGVSK